MASAHEDDEQGAAEAQIAIRKLDTRWRFRLIRTTGCPVEIELTRSTAAGLFITVRDIGRRWESIIGACRLVDHHFAHLNARRLQEDAWLTP